MKGYNLLQVITYLLASDCEIYLHILQPHVLAHRIEIPVM
jgi:hypothetical protein